MRRPHYAFGRYPDTPATPDTRSEFEQFAGIGPAREDGPGHEPEGPSRPGREEPEYGLKNDSRSAFERFAGIGPAREPEKDKDQERERDIER